MGTIKSIIGKIGKVLLKYDAQKISILDCRKCGNGYFDYLVVCHVESSRQMEALVKHLTEELEKSFGINPWRISGLEEKIWVAIDYIDIIVHIFDKNAREYYDIEGAWRDAAITTLNHEKSK